MARETLARSRLIAAADRRWQGGLSLMVGGPGMGKSTLIAQMMVESDALGRGREYVVRCQPGWTADALHRHVCQRLGIEEDLAVLADAGPGEVVCQFLWSSAPERVGLILDDAQHLDASALDYVVTVNQLLPSNAHLFVATRDQARILARALAENPVLVIDEAELLFTADEVARFAAAGGHSADAFEQAGGWPALIGLRASTRPDVADTYLYDQVLADLDADAREDLAVAAALGDLDADLVPLVLDGPVSALSQVPMVEISADGRVMAHDLWNSQLSGTVDAQRIDKAAATVAEHLVERGDIDRAVQLLADRGLTDLVRHHIVRNLIGVADRMILTRVDSWITLTGDPEHRLLRSTLLLLRRSIIDGHLDTDDVDALVARIREAGEMDLEVLVREVQLSDAWAADDADLCLTFARRLKEMYDDGVELAAYGSHIEQVILARSEGDFEQVLTLLAAAAEDAEPWRDLEWNLPRQVETLLALGRPFEALEILDRNEDRLAAVGVRTMTIPITFWFCGQPDRATTAMDQLVTARGQLHAIQQSWESSARLLRSWRGMPSPGVGGTNAGGGTGEMATAAGARVQVEAAGRFSQICDGLADIGHLIDDGDVEAAGEKLNALADSHPPADSISMMAWSMGGSAWYVLRPEDRPMLDAFMDTGLYGEARALFRLLVTCLDGEAVTADQMTGPPLPEQIATLLPRRWAVTFAVALDPGMEDVQDRILASLGEGRAPGPTSILEELSQDADRPVLAARAASLLASRPLAPSKVVRVKLFGASELDLGDGLDAEHWRRGRVRALLGLLLLRGRVTREAAIAALWPELDEVAGRRNLRVTLSYLIRALEPDRPRQSPSWFVQTDQDIIELNQHGMQADVTVFNMSLAEAVAQQRQGRASDAIDGLRRGVEAYTGDFLQGLDDEWIEEERSVLQQRASTSALRLAALLTAGGSAEAARWAEWASAIDPYSIEALELLIDLLDGRPDEQAAVQARLATLLS